MPIGWINAKRFKLDITENLIREKANKLSLNLGIERLTFSDGWMRNFKKRNGIKYFKQTGNEEIIILEDKKKKSLS